MWCCTLSGSEQTSETHGPFEGWDDRSCRLGCPISFTVLLCPVLDSHLARGRAQKEVLSCRMYTYTTTTIPFPTIPTPHAISSFPLYMHLHALAIGHFGSGHWIIFTIAIIIIIIILPIIPGVLDIWAHILLSPTFAEPAYVRVPRRWRSRSRTLCFSGREVPPPTSGLLRTVLARRRRYLARSFAVPLRRVGCNVHNSRGS